MAALPNPISPTVAKIFASYEAKQAQEAPRPHLGASMIGRECSRQLWYQFRWCITEQFEGRMLRLFERGQREEDAFARDLRAAGVEVHTIDPRTGQQFRFSVIGGHVGGSMDAALHGIIEAPKAWHVGEFKTHNNKSFSTLIAKGVQAAKPEHWAQMQLYMHWSGMERAFYLAVNKDTDALHGERIRYDRKAAEQLEAKAARIVQAQEPPERIHQDPSWYQCKLCPAAKLCHGKALPPPTCRSCLHATPELDGNARWSCALYLRDIPQDKQQAGCDQHRYIPALVTFAEASDACPVNNWVAYRTPDDRRFINGSPEMGGYLSAELRSADPAIIDQRDFTDDEPQARDPSITYRWHIDGNTRHLGCYSRGKWRHWLHESHPDYATAVAQADAALEAAA